MKYMLMIYMNPTTWESLAEEERNAVFGGHETFQKTIVASGEFVRTEAFADPANSVTVRVRDGAVAVTEGLYLGAQEFCCGYYLVDCASEERAIELAALVPDAQHTAMEVRPLLDIGGE